ncbi:type VI secretion system protein TssA [Burkholderia pseudomallei]|uniref:type VI secretion system protein TssA n=1 Tax=Burkholderia pseudomallei TaxID=28450 RepID=UPI000F58ABFE|nr:type VI secretion system protein TssA [Burkholderia pseudomallei]MBM5578462.1 type VI secretion system protein TssA [Burkholderia pseudomallei]MBM5585187.1 type VI secretion system protein TssA [Burkholderia pseudomallei]RPA00486.1 type VI secretion system protein TssA [Burkholderia pseudomallei]
MQSSDPIESLLAGVAPDAPCGANLEYEQDFLRLQESATLRPEQQYGDTVIPAEAPDWSAVERLALELTARTKDLRVAAHLARSWTELRGMPGYADGLRLVAGMLDRWWDDVHPRLDADGDHDPAPRANALAEIAGAHGCARAARRQALFDGGPSVRDAERVFDGRDGGEHGYPGGRERLIADLVRARDGGQPTLQAAFAALDALDAIRARVASALGGEWVPDASDFEKALRRIVRDGLPPPAAAPAATNGAANMANAAHGGAANGVTNSAANGAASGGAPAFAANGRAWRDAELASRDDVQLGLEKMCRYFELHEPSHPAPILLRRAQRLLSLDFYEIIRDLAPESLPKLDLLSGQRNE